MGIYKDSILTILYSLLNRPYITSSLREMSHPLLIHISDTPEFVYPFIFRLVEQLRPEVLIHTGDMFDEIKLEDRPKEIKEYSSKLKKIMNRLEQLPVKQIFLIPGNHDNTEVIMDLSRKIVVLPEKSRIELEGLSLFLSHKYYDQKVDTDFYLFGHSLPEINRLDIETKLLNGIPCINFISLSTGTTYTLNYPLGTDSTRMMLPKIGI